MIKYKKQITAFIDVLGFGNIVFNSSNLQINSYFEFLKSNLRILSRFKKIKCFYISDSIILIANNDIQSFIKLIQLIQSIQSSLLGINIIVRGGITVGDIYLNKSENIIVGPSLINSYKLEQDAIFPRVIIDRNIIRHFNFTSTNEFIEYINGTVNIGFKNFSKLLKIDNDELLYVNYFSHFFSRGQNITTKGNVEKLFSLIQSSYFTNLHLAKYSWLKEKCIVEMKNQIELQTMIAPVAHNGKSYRTRKIKHYPIWIEKFEQM